MLRGPRCQTLLLRQTAHDAVILLQKLTSFMTLRDPELLAATTSAVGADALMPLLVEPTPLTEKRALPVLCDPHHQPRQPPKWIPEDYGEAMLMQ